MRNVKVINIHLIERTGILKLNYMKILLLAQVQELLT